MREGYGRTCSAQVLSVAEVAEPVFAEHFESIRDCFLQVNDELLSELELTLLRSLYSDAPWPERIRRGLQTLLEVIAEHPDHARVVLIECTQAGDRAVERLREAESVFVPVLDEGRAYAASVSHLSEISAAGVLGGISGIVHSRVLRGDTAELPGMLGDLLHFALVPYIGHEGALAAAAAAR
jgi:AcrR family transcriptional regulator